MQCAVVACSGCGKPWAVELRHRTATCPGCGRAVELATRRRLWRGDTPAAAQAAAARLRAALAPGVAAGKGASAVQRLLEPPVPRHDSPIDAAAAQARRHRNLSRRADEVALWMTRLCGATPHADLVQAMVRSGIDAVRAEREVVRLLATDILFEPRAGHYQVLRPD